MSILYWTFPKWIPIFSPKLVSPTGFPNPVKSNLHLSCFSTKKLWNHLWLFFFLLRFSLSTNLLILSMKYIQDLTTSHQLQCFCLHPSHHHLSSGPLQYTSSVFLLSPLLSYSLSPNDLFKRASAQNLLTVSHIIQSEMQCVFGLWVPPWPGPRWPLWSSLPFSHFTPAILALLFFMCTQQPRPWSLCKRLHSSFPESHMVLLTPFSGHSSNIILSERPSFSSCLKHLLFLFWTIFLLSADHPLTDWFFFFFSPCYLPTWFQVP